MPVKNKDLHGNAPDKAKAALLIIDMINDMEFEDGDKLFRETLPVAKNILKLKKRAAKENIPIIYVNDNFGKWQSDFNVQVDHCINDDVKGREIVKIIKPGKKDYFVLKPKHSGFFSTTLDVLLHYLGIQTLILTGVTADICIYFTASDAYMRDLNLYIPGDCVASVDKKTNDRALKQMKKILKANISQSSRINLKKINQ